MKHIHINALPTNGGPVWPGRPFATPWLNFDYAVLKPNQSIAVSARNPPCEQGYLVLSGQIEVKNSNEAAPNERFTTHIDPGPSFIIAPIGLDHVLHNICQQDASLLHVRVALDDLSSACSMRSGVFAVSALQWRDAIHGGAGRIATRHVLRPEDFYSTWTFLDHAVLSPGGSVGYHYHDALEECFVVLCGKGLMTIDDETFVVEEGSITWQGIGQGHGIYNSGSEELAFLRVAVAQKNEAYTTIDLHDDLSGRKPA